MRSSKAIRGTSEHMAKMVAPRSDLDKVESSIKLFAELAGLSVVLKSYRDYTTQQYVTLLGPQRNL